MTIKYRRFFYIFLFIIFLFCTPIAIYYTQGFRYNFKLNTFQKTGALYIRSAPTGAAIIINDKSALVTTPNKLSDLLPGVYKIKVEKNGYLPWQKNLEIKSSLTTFAEDIFLFKNQFDSILINSGEIVGFLPSPSKNKIIYQSYSENIYKIWIYYANSQKSDLIKETNFPLKFIAWSADEEKILNYEVKNGYSILDLNVQNKLLLINDFSKFNFDFLVWDDQNPNLLWGITKNLLKQIDIQNEEVKNLESPELYNILPTNDGHYFIYKNVKTNKIFLAFAPEKKFENFFELGELPDQTNYKIEKSNDWLFVYNSSDKQLYFLQFKNQKITFYNTLKNINGYELKDSTLLYWSDYEYWINNLTENKNELIERLSSPIINVLWHPQANYLLVEAENQLKITEIDNREEKNIYPIFSTQQNLGKKITFTPDNEKIIFVTIINDQNGIFSLALQ